MKPNKNDDNKEELQYSNPTFEQDIVCNNINNNPDGNRSGCSSIVVATVQSSNEIMPNTKEKKCTVERTNSSGSGVKQNTTNSHRKGHRRQESMYQITGLYSDAATSGDDSSLDAPTTQEPSLTTTTVTPTNALDKCTKDVGKTNTIVDSVIKCHSRQPSSAIVNSYTVTAQQQQNHSSHLLTHTIAANNNDDDNFISRDCGILTCRPRCIQSFARIKIFVLLLSMLVTLQQALSSGYINSVITTIEKRFEIPSSYSGLIASSYEIGNVITVIFVSYLGSRRHIPVWIGVGAVVMALGSFIFMVPHFAGEPLKNNDHINETNGNICRSALIRNQEMDLGRLSSGLSNQPLAPHTLRENNCLEGKPSTTLPVLLFVLAQLLLGCGGSPLFTLGTTYVDDHVKTESSSMYIGCMYSMAAFGPVLGFLLGAYLLSFHMDSLSPKIINISPGDHRWIGMWWGGFFLCGLLLLLVAIPFFSFPKVLTREKKKKRRISEVHPAVPNNSSIVNATDKEKIAKTKKEIVEVTDKEETPPADTSYGRDIKDIPQSMVRLVTNPVYIVTCFGACMELIIVSGFVVFLPKYLETQFSLGKSQASVFTGSIAIPGACIGIFTGGCILKRFQLKPKGAIQLIIISNMFCLAFYAILIFMGCDNLKMAGTTIPYYNSSKQHGGTIEPFQVNLTAACNFGCECITSEVEPVCGNNGLTYFSPCHAGCTSFSSGLNYTNCACVRSNISTRIYSGPGGSHAQALNANEDFAEVTVVPVATAGPCLTPCRTIYPFLILLFFMTFIVASAQMPLLMIVLRSVSEEERSFALGMQFVIFRLFGYIPAPILFGNLIDSTCLLWKSACGEKGGRCLIYDIEKFRYKYVGLCASVKIIALGIFIMDWWLIRRRKHMEKMKSLNASDPIIGSIISLDKLFEEKLSVHENLPNYGNSASECIIAPEIMRHSRNNSRTVQLEYGYDKCNNPNQLPLNEPQTKSKKHFRSASCDVKMIRTFNKEQQNYGDTTNVDTTSKFKNLKKLQTHTRNHSSDLNAELSRRLQSRTNSRCDDPTISFKYIQNQLKPPLQLGNVNVCDYDDDDDEELTTGCGHFVKKHKRNHSYDQIYMPNNIRFDPEFLRNHHHYHTKKSVNHLKNLENIKVKNSNESETSISAYGGGHSRNNSKDLNIKTISNVGGNTVNGVTTNAVNPAADTTTMNVLRHRRSNSNDLNYIAMPPSEITAATTAVLPNEDNTIKGNISSVVSVGGGSRHIRNASHQKIQIDDDRSELINNVDDDDDDDEVLGTI